MTDRPAKLSPYASPLLWPLAWSYAIGVRLKNIAYDRRCLQPKPLSWPVVSVGNLSVGGTGKTPLVMFLADRLKQRGWSIDVLSRGYGRDSTKVAPVDPVGTPEDFGDEPLLMARHGLSVYVGANRFQPGQMAENAAKSNSVFSNRLHILDDGFQHRRLARQIDIVLVQRADLDGRLLPVGWLREPLRSLSRADFCVLRTEDADLSGRVMQMMPRAARNPEAGRVWIVERKTTLPEAAKLMRNALAFCAVGDAKGFFDGLRRAGVDPQATIAFRDHHLYTLQDMENLRATARRRETQCFLTTEKDSVRLCGPLRSELEKAGPLIIAGLEVSLEEEARCIEALEALLNERLQLRSRNVR